MCVCRFRSCACHHYHMTWQWTSKLAVLSVESLHAGSPSGVCVLWWLSPCAVASMVQLFCRNKQLMCCIPTVIGLKYSMCVCVKSG